MSCRGRPGWGCSSIRISSKDVLAFMLQFMLEFHITGSWMVFCQDWTTLYGGFRLILQNVGNSTVSLGARDTHVVSQVKYWAWTVHGSVYLEAGMVQVSFFSNSCLALYALCAYCIALHLYLLCFAEQKWHPSFSVMLFSLVLKFTILPCVWNNSTCRHPALCLLGQEVLKVKGGG